ncbi:MAG: response regulator [Aliidongia sp.]
MARVLIVDDDDVIGILLSGLVEAMGHEAIKVQNGVDALQAYQHHAIDLVITDIYMPDMDGLELIRKINAAKPAAPIIAMSGNASGRRMDALPTAGHFGAAAVLYKPVDLDAMALAITRLLARPVAP